MTNDEGERPTGREGDKESRNVGKRIPHLSRCLKIALATVWSGCAPLPWSAPAPAPAQASPSFRSDHRVVVAIVVDQLAGWIAEERWPELPRDGGFARLIREGTWAKRVRYAHAVTDTAPGHSALYTAAVPHDSGIFANEVIDAKGKRGSVLRDPQTHLVTDEGEQDSPGASLVALRVDTLADRLHRARPDAVVVSLSLKDRGALFAAGRQPRAAVWFDPKLDRFVTSTAFAHALPEWARTPAAATAVAHFQSQTWDLLDPAWVTAHARTPDAQPGEGDVEGLGIVFPHVLAGSRSPGNAFRTSPFADQALFDLALAAIDQEGVKEHDALIALSLSANDYIGHAFGPDSWEAWDELDRLDGALGRFLDQLDVRFGKEGYSVLLTADHGVTTMPEAAIVPGVRRWCADPSHDSWERACGPVGRILPDALAEELRVETKRALGDGDWVASVGDPYVYLTPAARGLEPRRQGILDGAILRALRAHPEVDSVIPTRAIPAVCPPETDESIAALVCRSVAAGAGDYYVVVSRGSFFDPNVVTGKGTSHGSPYLFDRTVPLLARAPGKIRGGALLEQSVGFETFARTAAALLGVDAPGNAASGADLFDFDLASGHRRPGH